MRVEAARRLLPRCWFNEETTGPGVAALGFYHERRDSQRKVGLGPEHDWSSHAADAFGLMCVAYEEPSRTSNFNRPLAYRKIRIA
jgi:phage terminase large subunit